MQSLEKKLPEEKTEKNVVRLGMISLLTDVSSEMIYPFYPFS
jgi:hypothetical protein